MCLSPLTIIYAAVNLAIAVLLVVNPELILRPYFLVAGTLLTAGLIFYWLARQIGWAGALLLFALSAAIGFAAEFIGVNADLYFGGYSYTEFLGPQLGGVPLLIPVAWFTAATTAFMAARLVLGFGKRTSKLALILLASLLAVAYDIPIEYMARYVWQSWQWHGSGPLLGVPWSNFIGWFVVAFLIFGLGSREWRSLNRDKAGYRDLQVICFVSYGLVIFHLLLDLLLPAATI